MISEIARIARFIAVGAFNTALGYALIITGILLGFGDYAANIFGFALSLPISYLLHRRITFQAHSRTTLSEAMLYAVAFIIAFCVNLGVLAAGRKLGYTDHYLVQLLAICAYAAVFYVLTRLLAFRVNGHESTPQC